jgi:hypothetical protein
LSFCLALARLWRRRWRRHFIFSAADEAEGFFSSLPSRVFPLHLSPCLIHFFTSPRLPHSPFSSVSLSILLSASPPPPSPLPPPPPPPPPPAICLLQPYPPIHRFFFSFFFTPYFLIPPYFCCPSNGNSYRSMEYRLQRDADASRQNVFSLKTGLRLHCFFARFAVYLRIHRGCKRPGTEINAALLRFSPGARRHLH